MPFDMLMICLWYVYDMFMICLWYAFWCAYDMFMICLWHVYDMFMICLCYACDMLMVCLWYAFWYAYDMFMIMICLWYVYDMFMIFLWYVYDILMICLWYVYGCNSELTYNRTSWNLDGHSRNHWVDCWSSDVGRSNTVSMIGDTTIFHGKYLYTVMPVAARKGWSSDSTGWNPDLLQG